MQYICCMSIRIAWLLIAALALPSFVFAQVEEEVVNAIRGRLDAARRNDIAAGESFVADEMMAPLGEWLPESATTFFVPGEAAGGDSSRIVFVKDASGRVTHYIYRELGATDRIVKKVK